jgi:hypothetical protein
MVEIIHVFVGRRPLSFSFRRGSLAAMNTTRLHTSRRSFLQTIGLGAAALGLNAPAHAAEKVIPGFEKTAADASTSKGWKPVSDRKIRVGIAGFGYCRFGAGLHPPRARRHRRSPRRAQPRLAAARPCVTGRGENLWRN